MSRLPHLIALLAALSLLTVSCKDDKKEFLSGKIDPEKFPTMMTRHVETLISDSGVTRYRITSPLWLVFDEAREPYWFFPDSLMLEKYDNLLRTEATVNCDSAKYFKNQELWRLDGNVRIANVAKERFLTNQLFWDQRNHKIYSDSFIHIEKSDRIIEGYGFVSDEQMTNYTVNNVAGIFPVSDAAAPGSAGQTPSAAAPQPAGAATAPSPASAPQQVVPATAARPARPGGEAIKPAVGASAAAGELKPGASSSVIIPSANKKK